MLRKTSWLFAATLLAGCAGTVREDSPAPAPTGAAAAAAADGYAVTPGPGKADRALYDQLGGLEGIGRVVDALLAEVANDVRINLLFADTDLRYLRARIIEQVCEAAGGPCTYTGLSMEEAHSGQDIDASQFGYFVEDLVAAMRRERVPQAAQDQLLATLGGMREQILHQ